MDDGISAASPAEPAAQKCRFLRVPVSCYAPQTAHLLFAPVA